jgi:hypothetical protein
MARPLVITDWHREDINAALTARGWSGPHPAEPEAYFEGERLSFLRDNATLLVSFVADVGAGYNGPKSLEEAVATRQGVPDARLWLNRRRDSKWRSELIAWADSVSAT